MIRMISWLPRAVAFALLAPSIGWTPRACPWAPRASIGIVPLLSIPSRLYLMLIVGLLMSAIWRSEGGIAALSPFLSTLPTSREGALHHYMASRTAPGWLLGRHCGSKGRKEWTQELWISGVMLIQCVVQPHKLASSKDAKPFPVQIPGQSCLSSLSPLRPPNSGSSRCQLFQREVHHTQNHYSQRAMRWRRWGNTKWSYTGTMPLSTTERK